MSNDLITLYRKTNAQTVKRLVLSPYDEDLIDEICTILGHKVYDEDVDVWPAEALIAIDFVMRELGFTDEALKNWTIHHFKNWKTHD